MNWDIVFFTLFWCCIALAVYSVYRNGGFKGAMFGARILDKVGEVSAQKRGLVSQTLRVHLLETSNSTEQKIGIEFASSGGGSWGSMPTVLSSTEAQELIRLLKQATDPEYRSRIHQNA